MTTYQLYLEKKISLEHCEQLPLFIKRLPWVVGTEKTKIEVLL